jgi:hypothetical protein
MVTKIIRTLRKKLESGKQKFTALAQGSHCSMMENVCIQILKEHIRIGFRTQVSALQYPC